MISTASVQEAIITLLKADATLVTNLGDDGEIREENWMGVSYDYPQVRVHITRLAPPGVSGSCENTTHVCDFSVAYRAVGTSSKPTADGLDLVMEALLGAQLAGTGFVSQVPVKYQDVAGPIPEGENQWMSRIFLNTTLKET